MIYQLSLDLATRLQARLYPVTVYYGPERVSRLGCDSMRIVIARDTSSGDEVGAVVSQHRNPRGTHVRLLGCVATFEVSCAVAGARINEHEHECDTLVDAFLVELFAWGEESRAGEIPISEARYLTADERAPGAEFLPGVVYRLRFGVPRGVFARDYEGVARPEGSAFDASCSVRVATGGSAYEVIS